MGMILKKIATRKMQVAILFSQNIGFYPEISGISRNNDRRDL